MWVIVYEARVNRENNEWEQRWLRFDTTEDAFKYYNSIVNADPDSFILYRNCMLAEVQQPPNTPI